MIASNVNIKILLNTFLFFALGITPNLHLKNGLLLIFYNGKIVIKHFSLLIEISAARSDEMWNKQQSSELNSFCLNPIVVRGHVKLNS